MTKGSGDSESKRPVPSADGARRRSTEMRAKESAASVAIDALQDVLSEANPVQGDDGTYGESTPGMIMHDGNNASIVTEEIVSPSMPWTPRSLVRAKTAIIYKHTLNDTLLVLERNIFFFAEWTSYFVSLQEDHLLLFKSREKWEQGLKPDKIVELHASMMLGEMKVEVVGNDSSFLTQDGPAPVRLFRRKIVETDELDQWINGELRQSPVVDSANTLDSVFLKNPHASARCVLEFAAYNQNTFELWSKTIRRVLQLKRDSLASDKKRPVHSNIDEAADNNAAPSPLRPGGNPVSKSWRKYSVFLILALAYGVGEEQIRTAHETMDAIVVGGGHNGLVAAAYLAKAGKKVCVLEKRHLVGGAAVTEEIIPGFKFSPQFSVHDAEQYPKYEAMLEVLGCYVDFA
ncbi:hypothetical protein P43SY_006824 [Pythium insidiosum]|uniref:Amine oxidase domain-containing protein n=1 Tax=Pythium insidiosum TaxID=114742 RepID=A0AAD5M307_PYTIN|nr:hypothetical protein P43SY_006824 [Pythium insidiosum]